MINVVCVVVVRSVDVIQLSTVVIPGTAKSNLILMNKWSSHTTSYLVRYADFSMKCRENTLRKKKGWSRLFQTNPSTAHHCNDFFSCTGETVTTSLHLLLRDFQPSIKTMTKQAQESTVALAPYQPPWASSWMGRWVDGSAGKLCVFAYERGWPSWYCLVSCCCNDLLSSTSITATTSYRLPWPSKTAWKGCHSDEPWWMSPLTSTNNL